VSVEEIIETPGGRFTIRQARPNERDTVLDVMNEAATWLESREIYQWEPGRFDIALLEEAIAAGEMYLVWRDDRSAGTFSLMQNDPVVWGAQPPDAGYLHDFAIRRAFGGMQLGRCMLAWAERLCIAAGKTWLRLDCVAWNEPLNDYYRRAGFAYRRALGVYNPINLYEKRLWGAWVESPDLAIALAGPEDLDALLEIDASASAWSDAIGRPGGKAPRPLRDILAETIMRGEAWIARWRGERAGMIKLEWQDTTTWGQTPWDAVYVHGLSTHRDFAGKGVGLALLRWAERAAEAAGREYVRLDCNADNPELRAYYERAGFRQCGEVALGHRVAARYEKRIPDALEPA
jgi:ribosomal protein S18 acetylase RimI-like enzyme